MKITILSGGTGSDSIIRGLDLLGGNSVKITNLINLYDNGKSTGFCRRVMNCLGPSDLRKVQYSQIGVCDDNISNFFNNRIDLNVETFVYQCNEIISKLPASIYKDLLYKCILIFETKMIKYFQNSFNDAIIAKKHLQDFNIANICYSTLFFTHGVENTIQIFRKMFNIKHDVVINSYTNSQLTANCYGYVYKNRITESEIVELNGKSIIRDVFLDPTPECNDTAITCIKNTDLFIISSGTPYSSIFPTLMDQSIINAINTTNATKIIIGNNDFDNDSRNLDLDGILLLYTTKISLQDFTIIINSDAAAGFNECLFYNIYKKITISLDKYHHNILNTAKIIYTLFFNIVQTLNDTTKFVFDFDNTIFDENYLDISKENINLLYQLNQHYNIHIVSGNSIEYIKELDRKLELSSIPIWANGANDLYINYKHTSEISKKYLSKNTINDLSNFALDNNCFFDNRNNKCFTIKCINENRKYIYKQLQKFSKINLDDLFVRINGKTSIDILIDNPDKYMIYTKQDFKNMLYIGDSPNGNDKLMFKMASNTIKSNVKLTNILLRMFITN